jgi:uncharacterized protein (TIGR00288 family)
MGSPYSHAPHVEGVVPTKALAPNAALLIDFDNVTMGMRSDLSKELKNLLQTDVIKGKVTVQRAYADWRRYPQYIVPLSEASVDLIFAPAYGSSKKNATDIRMAIDGMELVFIRPEIGTFILLTGDSDFSSLVLKLKEYGKYVIGVGIQESSSDILVQNCDEYYSYTSLTGLTKASDASGKPMDPWALVEQAVKTMVKRGDVMRSDRLKQVMIEIDGSFAEGNFGFSKFSKFLAEAASRKLIRIHKLENGQYEILGGGGSSRGRGRDDRSRGRGGDSRSRRGRGRSERGERPEETPSGAESGDVGADGPVEATGAADSSTGSSEETGSSEDPLEDAYQILAAALEAHAEGGRDKVRDSDVKRKILALSRDFDEGELGFGKFSRFLRQALQHGVIEMETLDSGNQVVSLASGKGSGGERLAPAAGTEVVVEERKWELVSGKGTRSFDSSQDTDRGSGSRRTPRRRDARADHSRSEPPRDAVRAPEPSKEVREEPVAEASRAESPVPEPSTRAPSTREPSTPERMTPETPTAEPSVPVAPERSERSVPASPEPKSESRAPVRGMGVRGGSRSRNSGGVTLLEGQIIGGGPSTPSTSGESATPATSGGSAVDLSTLGLPTDKAAIVQYLTNSYKGVGEKTAEQLVNEFGAELFAVLHRNPDRLRSVIPRRAEQLLEGWRADFARRTSNAGESQ